MGGVGGVRLLTHCTSTESLHPTGPSSFVMATSCQHALCVSPHTQRRSKSSLREWNLQELIFTQLVLSVGAQIVTHDHQRYYCVSCAGLGVINNSLRITKTTADSYSCYNDYLLNLNYL